MTLHVFVNQLVNQFSVSVLFTVLFSCYKLVLITMLNCRLHHFVCQLPTLHCIVIGFASD